MASKTLRQDCLAHERVAEVMATSIVNRRTSLDKVPESQNAWPWPCGIGRRGKYVRAPAARLPVDEGSSRPVQEHAPGPGLAVGYGKRYPLRIVRLSLTYRNTALLLHIPATLYSGKLESVIKSNADSFNSEAMRVSSWPPMSKQLYPSRFPPNSLATQHAIGLALAICKGLVEVHGGRIRAESAGPGRGASFTFTPPISAETPAAGAGEGARTRVHPRGRRRPPDPAPCARRAGRGGLRAKSRARRC